MKRQFVAIGRAPRIYALYAALDYKWESPYAFQGEVHNYYEAVYVDRGKATVTEDGQIYSMCAGFFLLHKPMEFHRIQTEGQTHVLVLPFAAEGEYPESLTAGIIPVPPEMRDGYVRTFAKLRTYFYTHDPGLPDGCGDTAEPAPTESTAMDERFGVEAALSLSAWLTELSRIAKTDTRNDVSGNAEDYTLAVSHMRTAVYDPISMEELARREHISLSRLKQIFYRYAGISPKRYYTNLRVETCKKLLLSGLSAKEVAQKMHFSSPAYFSLFFKKETGLSPGEYCR